MWYLYIAAATGLVFEWMRPKEYDDISLRAKILVPTVAGLLWPVVVGWVIVLIVKEKMT